jgi:hypothetical protein
LLLIARNSPDSVNLPLLRFNLITVAGGNLSFNNAISIKNIDGTYGMGSRTLQSVVE